MINLGTNPYPWPIDGRLGDPDPLRRAERLYARLGWTRLGVVPDFALLPDGRPCATVFFWKRLGA